METKIVFNRRQLTFIVSWVVLSVIISAFLLHEGHATIAPIVNGLVNFSLILLGFVLTSFTIITSSLGSELTKRLKKDGAYYSFMTNFYWLIVLLFFNLSMGIVFNFINYLNNENIVVNILIMAYITLIMTFLWYGVTRLSRFIRSVVD